MTRETKIALLVGLGLIICFGVILGEARTQQMPDPSGAAGEPIDGDPFGGLSARNFGTSIIEVRQPEPPPRGQAAEFVSERPQVEPDPPPAAPEPEAVTEDPTPVVASPPPPASPSVRPVRPVPAKIYTVAPGDSLCKIARTCYGRQNERLYRLIFKANRDKLPDAATVKPGQRLVIPPLPARAAVSGSPSRPTRRQGAAGVPTVTTDQLAGHLRRVQDDQRRARVPVPAPAGRTARTYKVKRGDNLTNIARKMLRDGSPAAVRRLYRANKDTLPSMDLVPTGVVLVIPE